jgi:hypothetical protein
MVTASSLLDVDLPQSKRGACEIPARRGVLGQGLDLVAPGGDGGRKI